VLRPSRRLIIRSRLTAPESVHRIIFCMSKSSGF